MRVRRRKPIETKHTMASLREMQRRRTAHGPKANDKNSAHCPPQAACSRKPK